jgi:hypothetical protein
MSRIEAALARLGAEHEPPAGWEDKVLAQIEQGSWWRRLLRWKIAIPIAATAIAAIVIIATVIPHDRIGDRALALATTYRHPGGVFRGNSHQVGELMRAAATGGDRYRAVWVYCEDKLVLACPGGSGCSSTDDATIAEVELKTAGHYTIVALTSRSPISAPSGEFDGDVAGAEGAGARVTYEHVKVR